MAKLSLPAGVSHAVSPTGGQLYAVRFTLDGLRVNLGTYGSLGLAVSAMCRFKIADLEKMERTYLDGFTSTDSAITAMGQPAPVTAILRQDHLDLLANVDPSSLSFYSGVTLQGVNIPQTTVVAFLNRLYGIEASPQQVETKVNTTDSSGVLDASDSLDTNKLASAVEGFFNPSEL